MDYERVHLVKPEVFVYRIPPLQTNRAVRAADWKLDNPDWTGRLRLCSLSKQLFIKLEDKNSGELFAKAPVDKHPGIAVQSVADSSRYFVVRLMDDGGRSAFIGLGFLDRGDSFDFNVALQDFFKDMDRESKAEEEFASGAPQGPALDLAFKEGQTIRINIGGKDDSPSQPRPRPSGASAGGGPIPFLPPPPTGVVSKVTPVGSGSGHSTPSDLKVQPPAGSHPVAPNPTTNPFMDIAGAAPSAVAAQNQPMGAGDFFSTTPANNAQNQGSSSQPSTAIGDLLDF